MSYDDMFPETKQLCRCRFFYLSVIAYFQRCDFHVNSPDFSAFFSFYGISGFNGLHKVFQWGAGRMLTAEHQQTFVTFTFQNFYFVFNLFHRQSHAVEFLVVAAESAVQTVVGAMIGYIKWSKKNKAVAVDIFLDLMCSPQNFSD